jgi:hypothetical protein
MFYKGLCTHILSLGKVLRNNARYSDFWQAHVKALSFRKFNTSVCWEERNVEETHLLTIRHGLKFSLEETMVKANSFVCTERIR